MAAELEHISPSQVTTGLRKRVCIQAIIGKSLIDDCVQVKAICYGIIYGMGVQSLAAELEMTEPEAEDYQKTFHRKFPRYVLVELNGDFAQV